MFVGAGAGAAWTVFTGADEAGGWDTELLGPRAMHLFLRAILRAARAWFERGVMIAEASASSAIMASEATIVVSEKCITKVVQSSKNVLIEVSGLLRAWRSSERAEILARRQWRPRERRVRAKRASFQSFGPLKSKRSRPVGSSKTEKEKDL